MCLNNLDLIFSGAYKKSIFIDLKTLHPFPYGQGVFRLKMNRSGSIEGVAQLQLFRRLRRIFGVRSTLHTVHELFLYLTSMKSTSGDLLSSTSRFVT